MLMKRQAETATEEVGDDMILQQIDVEVATKIELERTTVPEEAFIKRYRHLTTTSYSVLQSATVKYCNTISGVGRCCFSLNPAA